MLLLIALVIGAFLAREAARQYGLTQDASAAKEAGSAKGHRAPVSDAPAADSSNASAVDSSNAPMTPIERARSVEDTIRHHADEQARRMP